MKKKISIVAFLVLLILTLVIFITRKDNLKTEIANSIPILKQGKKFFPSSSDTLDKDNTENKKTTDENQLVENKKIIENKDEPANIEQAEEEKSFWLEKIKRENAIERLNKNSLTEKERQEYVDIYKRLSQLDSYIYKNQMDTLAAKVDEVEASHETKLKELGISKQN